MVIDPGAFGRPARLIGVSAIIGILRLAATAAIAIDDGHAGGADQDVDLVLLDQLARVARRGRRVGAVVELDQLDFAGR